MTPRRRTDANQLEIITALRLRGCSVLPMHTLGHGAPDIAVGYAGHTFLMEIKSGDGKLTPDEERWARCWHGDYHVVHSVEDALRVVGLSK